MTDVLFNQIYELLEQEFPKEEIRSREKMRTLFENNGYLSFLSIEENGSLIGILPNYSLISCVFIESFAIKTKYQNKGLGSELVKLLQKKAGKKPIILEVEPVEDEKSKKRVDFYKSLGFKLNDFDYKMPPLNDKDEWMPLKIMSYPQKLTEEKFIPYKKEIFLEVYERDRI